MDIIEYNKLSEEEIKLSNEPASEEENMAFQDMLLSRGLEKKFVMKKIHEVIRFLGSTIFNHNLKDYKEELLTIGGKMNCRVKESKLFLLYRKIRTYKPKIMVEYGAGYSTALIAAMLDLNARDFGVDGKLISFEQNPEYSNYLNNLLPGRLSSRVKVCLSQIGYVKSDGYRQIFYKDSPDHLPEDVDLIFIDGPASIKSMLAEQPAIFSGDMLRLTKKCNWRHAFTDIRYFNHLYFLKVLSQYKVKKNIMLRTIEISK